MRQPNSKWYSARVWRLCFHGRCLLAFLLDHGHRDSRELLIDCIATLRGCLRFLKKVLETSRVSSLDHAEARFIAHVVGNFCFWWTVVEMKRWLTLYETTRVKAVKWPDPGIHCQL